MMRSSSIGELVDVRHGRISREVFVNDEIYRKEQEHLFSRAWLFVGHESQIPNAGDFFVSRMGEESVIVCRDREKNIHVFLNSCRHRGMKVCRYDEGNTPLFTCPYHAWSYSNDGKLVGIPLYKTHYQGCLDKAEWGLIEVPKLENYKGTIWASWDAGAPSFFEYLGEARTHLDNLLDCRDGREGGSEVLTGIQKWVIPCNWKFAAENFLGDTYHNVSHRSVDLVGIGPSSRTGIKGRRDAELDKAQHLWVSFPQGHGLHSALRPADEEFSDQFLDNRIVGEYYRHCFEERKRRLGSRARLVTHTGTIFPNASMLGMQPRALFVWHPNGPLSMELWRFFLVDNDAPAEVKDFLRHYYLRYSGPAGMTEQDDAENWSYATEASRGTIARRYPYNYQLSMKAQQVNDPVPGVVTPQINEENARNFYRRWATYVEGKDWEVLLGKNEHAATAPISR
ncbi:MAG TPA: aromatic ring-hydroxylating dioxygenase subunit alpha [Candidatus Acidoferrales bacterium]|jgi:phenylpropionate dioxygenase-like ring-hydroxylating dioxygenase large terminal subunit|nr:aromatic ring-hydroxylating dioxygenase subunit alpha [Candidatus Acidoferrales bacterium]